MYSLLGFSRRVFPKIITLLITSLVVVSLISVTTAVSVPAQENPSTTGDNSSVSSDHVDALAPSAESSTEHVIHYPVVPPESGETDASTPADNQNESRNITREASYLEFYSVSETKYGRLVAMPSTATSDPSNQWAPGMDLRASVEWSELGFNQYGSPTLKIYDRDGFNNGDDLIETIYPSSGSGSRTITLDSSSLESALSDDPQLDLYAKWSGGCVLGCSRTDGEIEVPQQETALFVKGWRLPDSTIRGEFVEVKYYGWSSKSDIDIYTMERNEGNWAGIPTLDDDILGSTPVTTGYFERTKTIVAGRTDSDSTMEIYGWLDGSGTGSYDYTQIHKFDVQDNQGPVFQSFASSPDTPKEGETVTMCVTFDDPEGHSMSYDWSSTDVTVTQISDNRDCAQFTVPDISEQQSISVEVTATDSYGASTTHSDSVTVYVKHQDPNAGFSYSPSDPLPGETVAFTSTVSDPDGFVTDVKWDFDDDGAYEKTGLVPDYTFDSAGDKSVAQKVIDDEGDVDYEFKTISVNAPPDADAGGPYTVDEEGSLKLDSGGSSDDGSISDVSWTLTSGPGSVSGSYYGAPDALSSDATAKVKLTVTDDDGVTDSDKATITINEVNDAPSASAGGPYSVAEGESVSLSGSGSDEDGTISKSWAVTSGPGSISGGTYSAPSNINNDKSATLKLTVTDDDDATATDTTSVEITNKNSAPTANDVSVSTSEGSSVSGSFDASDPDGDSLTYSIASGASNGDVSISGDSFTYTPNSGFSGSDSFTYRAGDGQASDTATVSVSVEETNAAPTANDVSVSTDEDTSVSGSFDASDPDGDTLTYSIVSSPSNGDVTTSGDSFTYTPTSNYAGSDSFTYQVSDGLASDTATVSVTVNAVNDPPTANDVSVSTSEGSSVSGTFDASDPDGDTLTYSIASEPSNGDVTTSGDSFTYTPDSGYVGSDAFTYRVSDGQVSDTATVSVSVDETNAAPTATDMSVSTSEGSSVTETFDASDPDGDTLTYSIASGASNGDVTISGDSFTYAPNGGFSGSDSFIYRASDGQASDTATVQLSVQPSLTSGWQFQAPGRLQHSDPEVGPTRVFVGGLDDTLVAHYRVNGTEAWTFHRSGSLADSSPAYHSGSVYVGSGGGTLYSLDAATGSVEWTHTTDSAIVSSPVVSDGTVYVGSNDGTVMAIDAATGTELWTKNLSASVFSTPAVGGGSVYLTTDDGRLVSLDADVGVKLWEQDVGSELGHTSPTYASGTVYVASDAIHAVDAADGSLQWDRAYGGQTAAAPTVVDGTLYIAAQNGSVTARDPSTGAVTWRHDLGQPITSAPTITATSVVVADADGDALVLDRASGNVVALHRLGVSAAPSWSVVDGTVYIGAGETVAQLGMP